MVTRAGNTRAKVSTPYKTTASKHIRNKVTSSLGLVPLVECPLRPPLPLLPPPLTSVMELLAPLAGTRTRSSQARSALATAQPTSVRHLARVHRQHCRGKIHQFHNMLVLQARPSPTSPDRCLGCWVSAQHVVLYIRSTQRRSFISGRRTDTATAASARNPRGLWPPVTKFQGAHRRREPAPRAPLLSAKTREPAL